VQHPVLTVSEPKKTGARTASQNPLVYSIMFNKYKRL
jgi:hypothetical protein